MGLNLAGGSSLLPYTNKTRDVLVAAFKKSVNNDGRVSLLSVVVSLLLTHLQSASVNAGLVIDPFTFLLDFVCMSLPTDSCCVFSTGL